MSKRQQKSIRKMKIENVQKRAAAIAKAVDGLDQIQTDAALLYAGAMEALAQGKLNAAIMRQDAAAQISADARKRVRVILNVPEDCIWSHSPTCPIVLDAAVDVGGCVGTISKITDTQVIVRGTYYYSDGDGGGFPEDWAYAYDRAELAKVPFLDYPYCNKDGMHRIWDASKLREVHNGKHEL